MKKIVIVLIALTVCITGFSQTGTRTKRVIKIDDFEFHCDSCTVEEALKEAQETYYEAVADVNAHDSYEKSQKRVMIHGVDMSDIQSDENCSVYLVVKIDSLGNVVECRSTSKTNTYNNQLIDQVIKLVKEQVKYSQKDTVYFEFDEIRVNIMAN